MRDGQVKGTIVSEIEESKGDYRNLVGNLRKKKAWQTYIDAPLGFRNHWYPALFSHELAEDEVKGETLLGEAIAFKRVDGKVYAFQDQCLHRGVPFTAKPECYTKNTITCWYHGFTFNVKDGHLETIITQPDLNMKVSIKTYVTEEKNGIIFVFIGDMRPVPPLERDVQPGFLDEGFVTRGIRRVVDCNWRLGVENSFDYTHIYIHREDLLMKAFDIPLPFATKVKVDKNSVMMVEDEHGPKGLHVHSMTEEPPIYEVEIEGVKVVTPRTPDPDKEPEPFELETSIWMPGALKVDPWPKPGTIQYAWNVPIDENRHVYWAVMARKVDGNEEKKRKFYEEVDSIWVDLALTNGFNDTDIFARKHMHKAYAEEDFWYKETLYQPDFFIIQWRLLCSRHNRGVQTREAISGT